jgi:hypothetical protein
MDAKKEAERIVGTWAELCEIVEQERTLKILIEQALDAFYKAGIVKGRSNQ